MFERFSPDESTPEQASREAIETLGKVMKDPKSPIGLRVKRAHDLITLAKQRMSNRGTDMTKQITEAENLLRELKGDASNNPEFKEPEDRKAA